MGGPNPDEEGRFHRAGLAMAVGAAVCWGLGNLMVRQPDLPGPQLAFWRTLLGTGVYAVALAVTRRRLSWACIRGCWLAGAAMAGWIVFFYLAIRSTTVTNASLIGSLLPVILLGVAVRQFGEPVTLRLAGMVAAALAGTALVLYGSSSAPTWSLRGDGMALVSTLLFAAYFILVKQARQQFGVLELLAAVYAVASVALLPVAVIDAGGLGFPGGQAWGWMAAMVAVPGSGHLLMNWAHRHVGLSITSTVTLASTPVSAVGAALFLDEPIVALQVVGAAVTFAALTAVIRADLALSDRHSDA